jgi:hypothetical protein
MTNAPKPNAAPAPFASIFPGDDVLYISDERVAASYHGLVGDYVTVKDPAERAWLVANEWAYDRTSPALPAAYHHGNNGAWTGYPPPAPTPAPTPTPPPPPAVRKTTAKASDAPPPKAV